MTDLSPIRREVLVELAPDDAFTLFTDRIGAWWPVAELSVFGADTLVAFTDGVIVETLGEQTSIWGRVTEWEPGVRLAFSWHPGRAQERASRVSVSFTPEGSQGTLVVLEHAGWEQFDDPAGARSEYGQGWPRVLGLFRDAAARLPDPGSDTWVALVHCPGAAAPTEGSVFDDPRFADHAHFLEQMRERGYLVAAGPMADELGSGMTILRLPGADRLEEATRLATQEDRSVAAGFFDVTVRPWQVMLSG